MQNAAAIRRLFITETKRDKKIKIIDVKWID